ncbi:putative porin [bacterium]|nr:putative porin [bacterium]
MKRFALFAVLLAAGFGLQAITIGDTEVDLGADLRTRYQDFDGDTVLDFEALDARWRLWASADITDSISVAIRLNVAEGELGSPGSSTTNSEFGFNGTNGMRAIEHAYITWHNEWGDVMVGRIPAAAVGNDLVLDSYRYDGGTGGWEGAAVVFSDFNGWNLALVYIDANTGGVEDEGMGLAAKISLGELIGWNLHIGFEELNDDLIGIPGEEYTAMFAGADIPLSDVADLEISWIDGDTGSIASGNAFLIRLDYDINEELGLHAAYGKTETGAIANSGCGATSGAVCGGFGWEPSIMTSHGGIGTERIGFPASGDGSMITFQLRWGDHWTFSYIDWSDDGSDEDDTVLRLEHIVEF